MSGVLIERGRVGLAFAGSFDVPVCQLNRFSRLPPSRSVLDPLDGVKLRSFITLADLPKNVLTLFLSMDPGILRSGFLVGVSCGTLSLRAVYSGDGVCLEYSLKVSVSGE